MKKIIWSLIISLILGISFIGVGNIVNAADGDIIIVTVTEKIPGAECTCKEPDGESCPKSVYNCEVKPGFGTVVGMMGSIVKYATFLAGLFGVLFIVFNGIMYSMGGIEQSLKDNAKKRIIQTLIGLTLLFLSGVILNLVAPWIYTV